MASLLNTCSVVFFICFILYSLAEPPYKPGENEWFSNDPLTRYFQKLWEGKIKPCNGTTIINNNNNNNRGAPVPTKDGPQPQKMMKLKMKPKAEEEKKEGTVKRGGGR